MALAFPYETFKNCVTRNLENKGYGETRSKEILMKYDYFNKVRLGNNETPTQAALGAMNDVNAHMTELLRDKTIAAAKAMAVQADTRERLMHGITIPSGLKGLLFGGQSHSAGFGLARAIGGTIEADARMRGTDFFGDNESYLRKYWAIIRNVTDNFRKGAFGRQIAPAIEKNIVYEIRGQATGDFAAKEVAQAIMKADKIAVEDRNLAGGALKYLDGYLPQSESMAKLMNTTPAAYIKDALERWNWDKMRWDNGELIAPDQRAGVAEYIQVVKSTDGATKIDPRPYVGKGRSMGNQLDQHRFVIIDDPENWWYLHGKYGDGSVYDVFERHFRQMAHTTALVNKFGRNPEAWFEMAKAMGQQQAGIVQATAHRLGTKRDFTSVSDFGKWTGHGKRVDLMFEAITHQNFMDPNSRAAAAFTTSSNLINAAISGGIPLTAMPGDFMTTVAVRLATHQGLKDVLGTYLTGIATPGAYGKMENLLARQAFSFDESISSNYAMTRYTGLATWGPSLSRRVSDTVSRLSGLIRHTNMLRGANIMEHMGALDASRDVPFADHPLRRVMERYGITSRDWDVMRKLPPWEPENNATYMSPYSVLQTNLIDKDQLYRKFYNMLYNEARYMVPGSTLEARVTLTGNRRPDTLAGMVLNSFSMFKNFSFTIFNLYGRLAMDQASWGSRLGVLAGVPLGLIGAGALTVQLRELKEGRTPLPTDRPDFWVRAMLTSGAMGIWGDVLFGGLNSKGRSPAEIVGGPLAGFAMDTANLMFGPSSKWLAAADIQQNWSGDSKKRLVEFLARNTPGSNIWWASLALKREIIERLDRWADPQRAQSNFNSKKRQQQRLYGNSYWAPPGEGLFTNGR